MRHGSRVCGVLGAFLLLLGLPGIALAQNDTATTDITVEIIADPGMLLVSAAYTSVSTPIFTDGGISKGQLQVRVVDTRLSGLGWYVEGRIGAFTIVGPGNNTFPAQVTLGLVSTEPPTVFGAVAPVLSSETAATTFVELMSNPVRESGLGTWDTTILVPAASEPGSYRATLTLNLYAGNPP